MGLGERQWGTVVRTVNFFLRAEAIERSSYYVLVLKVYPDCNMEKRLQENKSVARSKIGHSSATSLECIKDSVCKYSVRVLSHMMGGARLIL